VWFGHGSAAAEQLHCAVPVGCRAGLKASKTTWPLVPPIPKPLMLTRLVRATDTWTKEMIL
jgi:hypothetical protein